MKKLTWLRISWLTTLVVSLSLHLTYQLSPNYVDPDGFLVEEFWALGLGQIFLVTSAGLALLDLLRSIRQKRS